MVEKKSKNKMSNLPIAAKDYINLIIKKMRYRKNVRTDVQAELVTDFEEELKECSNEKEREEKALKLIEEFGDAKLLAVLLRRAKKRCRSLWRTIVARTFQAIGVLIICFILYCIYISLGNPTISTNYLEEATLLTRPVADESLNAAPLYQKAFDSYVEPPKLKQGEKQVILTDLIKNKETVNVLTEEEISALDKWLIDNNDTITFFKEASRRPHCWWERKAEDNVILVALMPELSSTRNLVKMIVWQAKLKAHNGDIEGAFEDLLICYRSGKHFKGPRVLIEQLVGIAVQALATKNLRVILESQPVDSQLLKTTQNCFEQLIAEDIFIINYEVERFWVWDFIQRCYTDDGKGSGRMIPGQLEEFYWYVEDYMPDDIVFGYGRFLGMALAGANRQQMREAFEELYHNAEEWAKKTPWQLHQENIDFEMGLNDWSYWKKIRYWPVTVFMPALGRVNEISYRVAVDVRSTLTIIAIQRYKQDIGQCPENLEELVTAGYLKELPLDSFSNKPLGYKKTQDDFILYSVGSNFTDDGGKVAKGDNGRALSFADEGDWVFWPVQ